MSEPELPIQIGARQPNAERSLQRVDMPRQVSSSEDVEQEAEADGEWEERKMCERCKCCEAEWYDCSVCGGTGHTEEGELYEEDPLWYHPDDIEACYQCGGEGGGWCCSCNGDGKHEARHIL